MQRLQADDLQERKDVGGWRSNKGEGRTEDQREMSDMLLDGLGMMMHAMEWWADVDLGVD